MTVDIDIITDETGAHRIGEALAQIVVETQAVAWGESQHVRSHRGIHRLGEIENRRHRRGRTARRARLDSAETAGRVEDRDLDVARQCGDRHSLYPWQIPGVTLQHEHDAYRRLRRDDKVRLIEERPRSLQ